MEIIPSQVRQMLNQLFKYMVNESSLSSRNKHHYLFLSYAFCGPQIFICLLKSFPVSRGVFLSKWCDCFDRIQGHVWCMYLCNKYVTALYLVLLQSCPIPEMSIPVSLREKYRCRKMTNKWNKKKICFLAGTLAPNQSV